MRDWEHLSDQKKTEIEIRHEYTPAAVRRGGPSDLDSKRRTPPASEIYESVARSDADLVKDLRELAAQAARECGLTAREVEDVVLAAGEALANAYRHGSPHKSSNRIRLRCLAQGDALIVEVVDEGPPFEPRIPPKPETSKLKSGGLGIYLMAATMDEVEFSHDGCGNRVRMVKKLRPGQEEQ